MEISLLIATPPVPSRRLPLSRLDFASPLRFLPRLPSRRLLHCRRCRLSLPRCYVSQAPVVAPSVDPSVFGGPKELSGPQAVVSSLPPPARLASSIVLAAIAIAAGFGIGVRLGGTKAAGIGVAAALGAASGAAAYSLNSKVPEVAAVSLHNLVVGYNDPADLRKDEVEAIVEKYGVSKQDDAFKAELRDLYSRFVSSILPSGSENLKGNEAESIIKFKDALGIDDPDAALVHVEIGRHIYRQRLETGDREADIEQRRAFQKLIYVSTLVFGEASKFLLPWKRLFNVTDSQIEIAIRDNAQKLYASKLKSIGQDIDEKQLIDLRRSQLLYKLSDQISGEMFREHTRKLVEENISSALLILKSRTHATKGIAHVVQELDKVLAFNNLLTSLSKHHENGQFAPGVEPISLLGGEYDGDRKFDDLKILYRTYAEESFPDGRLQEEKLAALNQLRNIFGLGKREAENIMLDVTARVYRRRLARAFSGGDLDAAPSKAAYLQNLCEELHFDPNNASKIHEEIYRQKLQQFVEDGELSDEEVASLQRYRVLLCIHQETVDATHADICGRLFEKAVRDAIASGVDGYDDDMRNSVRKASQGLRLTTEAAMAIASKAVRKVFITYIQRSKSAGSRTEAAKELKKLIAFNALVVTDLVSDIKGEPVAPNEPIDVEAKQVDEEDGWESLQTLRKTRPSKELDAKSSKPVQTEITLRDDLPERDRSEIYRTYLLFCITGETTAVPFGAQIVTKKDNSEFQLLKQLGGILGMSDKEIVEVHRNFAEQAFMKQAEIILADGQLTKARIEQLNEVQKQVGLPAEYAQKVIKNITTTKMSRAIETAVAQGRIGIKQVRELKEANIDLDNMISERLRENLFKKTVEEIFSSGTGVFEEVEVYERIPSDLSIDAEKAKAIVKEHAKSRLSNTLVQAVAQLRQKNRDGVVSSLNDMLACDTAVKLTQQQQKCRRRAQRRSRERDADMAATACFLHHLVPSTAATAATRASSPRLVPKPNHLLCRAAQKPAASVDDDSTAAVSRRLALAVLIGAAAVGSKAAPADAAYGEAANVFGKPKTNTDFIAYNGPGFKITLPAKWNPSKEVEFPGQVLRYEDNFDSNSSVTVLVTPTTNKTIADYGSPEEFLSKFDYLLGKQTYAGKTDSEGGFDPDAVATANILETSTPVINGKQYYSVSVLTRTADGDEGGKHQLITASVSDGKLYICKAQAGDKRWFKGAQKYVEKAASSFSLA